MVHLSLLSAEAFLGE